MFTGIVEEIGVVRAIGSNRFTIRASQVMTDLKTGGSINVNGTCLTIKSLDDDSFSVDVVTETLRRTNLSFLELNDPVNLERPLKVNSRLDGHMVQGHVDGTGKIIAILREEKSSLLTIESDHSLMRYIVKKGSIAVDGTSLTVVDCTENRFQVTIIPLTMDNTVFAHRKVGDICNLEVDILSKYVESLSKY